MIPSSFRNINIEITNQFDIFQFTLLTSHRNCADTLNNSKYFITIYSLTLEHLAHVEIIKKHLNRENQIYDF